MMSPPNFDRTVLVAGIVLVSLGLVGALVGVVLGGS